MNDFKQKTAVLFIDLINPFDFDGGTKLSQHTQTILPNLISLKNFAIRNHLPIIYINDHYGLWQANIEKIISHCKNERSNVIIEALKPNKHDYFLIKPMHSAFFQTPLKSLLAELTCTNLMIAGIAGDICILFTVIDAYMYHFNMHVPRNCIASEEKESNNDTLLLMKTVMKATIADFNE